MIRQLVLFNVLLMCLPTIVKVKIKERVEKLSCIWYGKSHENVFLMGVGNGQNVIVYIIHLRNNFMRELILSIPTLIFHCCLQEEINSCNL